MRYFCLKADYRAHLHLKNPEANRVEGPELQLLFAAYQAIGNKTAGQTNELRNRYYSARQKNDTATMNEVMRTMGKLGEQTGREQEQFREAHKDGFLAAYLLNKRMYQYQNIEDLQREYDQLGASAKAMKLTRQVVERLDEMAAFAPGQKGSGFYASNTRRGFFVHVFHPRESENPRFLGVVVCSLSGGKSLHGGTL